LSFKRTAVRNRQQGWKLEAGNELAAKLERVLGLPPLLIEEISSIVALNAGHRAVAVATMVE
jgi:hypothetical protein